MARINIEDRLFSDPRFWLLSEKLGSFQLAIGHLVTAWFAAQEYCGTKYGIPKPVWQQKGLRQEIIDCHLAEDRGDFIYIKGSDKQFEWLLKRRKAGKRGGLAAQKRSREIIEESVKQTQAKPSKRNPLTLTLTPTLTLKEKTNTNTIVSNDLIVLDKTNLVAEEFRGNAAVEDLLAKVKLETQKVWLNSFGNPSWMLSEFRLAAGWLAANPQKAPKSNMARFLNSWLTRAWERYRKTIPSNRVREIQTKISEES